MPTMKAIASDRGDATAVFLIRRVARFFPTRINVNSCDEVTSLRCDDIDTAVLSFSSSHSQLASPSLCYFQSHVSERGVCSRVCFVSVAAALGDMPELLSSTYRQPPLVARRPARSAGTDHMSHQRLRNHGANAPDRG